MAAPRDGHEKAEAHGAPSARDAFSRRAGDDIHNNNNNAASGSDQRDPARLREHKSSYGKTAVRATTNCHREREKVRELHCGQTRGCVAAHMARVT